MTKKPVSIIILPSKGNKPFQVQLSTFQIKTICSIVIVSIILIAYATYFSADRTTEKVHYKTLKKQTIDQEKEIEQIKLLIDSQKLEIQELIEKEKKIRKILLGKSKIKHKQLAKLLPKEKETGQETTEDLKNTLKTIKTISQKLEDNLVAHLKKSSQYKSKHQATPSIKPVFGGRVMSRFGWRTHPLLKRKRFHNGIDIATWKGAPIKATADGIVEYAGWIRGFGYCVILKHNFGYKTIYGHCSQLLTKNGQFIKKGQVIAQVGSTGLSTGDHLHYEVKKWNKSISPTAYLDLDIFEANNKI